MAFSPLEQFNAITVLNFYFFGYDFSFLSVLVPFFLVLFFFEVFL